MKKFIISLFVLLTMLNAQYRVERIIEGGAEKFGEKNKETFNIFYQNQLEYSIERILNYDDPYSEAKLFNDGSLVIVNSFLNKIDFYSNSGNIISTVDNIDDEKFSYEKTVYFDADETEAAFLISNEKTMKSRIEIYSKFGNKLETLEAIGNKGKGILFDQEKDLIVYSTVEWNNTELSKNTLGISRFGEVLFSADNTFTEAEISNNIFAGYSNKSLIVIDLNSYDVLQNIQTDDKLISNMKSDNGNIFFIESSKPEFVNNKWLYSNSILKKYSSEENEFETIRNINRKYETIDITVDKGKINLLFDKSIKISVE